MLAAALAALVVPLALGATTWEQRAAVAVLVFAAGTWARPHTRIGALAGVALLVVLFSVPAAASSERAARADGERRTGERLLALNEPDRAVGYLQASGADREAAAVHLELAERAVATGFSGYPAAGEHLETALRLDPTPEAQRLAEAIAAARQADVIWNQYDWPRTIAELRKAHALRPDLPGLKDKLDAAEASYALARRTP